MSRQCSLRDPSACCLVLALILLGCLYVFPRLSLIDIALYDESVYLNAGVRMRALGIPSAQFAPLYAFYHFLLAVVQPDQIRHYFFSYGLISVLLPVAFFAFCRRQGHCHLTALALSIVLLLSKANFPMEGKVSSFASIVMLGVLACLRLEGMTRTGLLIAAGLATLPMAYVRPEFYLVTLASIGLCFCGFLYGRVGCRKPFRDYLPVHEVRLLSIFLGIAFGSMMFLGMPAFGSQQGRLLDAFGQHYALNWVQWNASSLNPWTNARTIRLADFPGATSVGSALLENPGAFGRHVWTNACLAITQIPYYLIRSTLPETPWSFASMGLICIAGGAAGCLLIGLYYWRHPGDIRDMMRHVPAASVLLCICAPVLMSILILHPRIHYLAMLYPVFLYALVLLSDPIVKRLHFAHWIAPVLLLPLGFILWSRPTVSPPRENLQIIRYLRETRPDGGGGVLDIDGGYAIYLHEGWEWIEAAHKTGPFDRYLLDEQTAFGGMKKARIEMIVVSEAMRQHPQYAADPAWQQFLSNPREFGFKHQQIPGTSKVLYERE